MNCSYNDYQKLKDARALGAKLRSRKWHKEHYDEFDRLQGKAYKEKIKNRITPENVPAQSAPAVPLQTRSRNRLY